jgi:hypothetical protein
MDIKVTVHNGHQDPLLSVLPWKSKNVYRHCMSTTVTLCFNNGLQLNAALVHVDFKLAAMKVLKEIF